MKEYLKISILVDNPKSWFNDYLDELFKVIRRFDPHFHFLQHSRQIKKGDILFILSCNHILDRKTLLLHKHNIVIHASDLPKGRGWSPLTWQVETGKNKIPVTLFEADIGCDTGRYYFKDYILLEGWELIDKIRDKEARKVIMMIKRFLSLYPLKTNPQRGRATYYRKRTPEDSQLNINKTIRSQFNKMRIADNQRYPLFFRYKDRKYILKIYQAEE